MKPTRRLSVFTEKRSKTRYAIRDTTLSQGVPVNRGIDRYDRLVDPEFCDASETSHCKVRPDLHDRFHCGIVDFNDGIPQLLFTHMRNLHGTATLQPLRATILKPQSPKKRRTCASPTGI